MLNVLGNVEPKSNGHNVKDQGAIKKKVAKALNKEIKDGISWLITISLKCSTHDVDRFSLT